MLTITSKGQTEALIHYTGYELFEEVNGALTLALTSFSVDENPGHALIEEEGIITADGRDFRVKQIKSTRNRKAVTAISTFFDLIGHHKYDIYGGTRTFNQFATWLFAGTGWTYEAGDVNGSKLIPNYGNDNFLKLMEVLLSAYECERQILPGKRIRFAKKIGPDNDAQYRYGHNIKALSHSVDTTNLRTSIKGFGGNGLEVTYTSPNASKFPHAGEAKPVRDERFTVASSLLERIKQDLNDVPETAIELDALELTEKELGERVWLIYEPLGIEFQTRILAKTTRIPKERSSAVIGNAMPKTLTDVLTEQNVKIDENAKQTQSKFEQTNEQFLFEVERLEGDITEAITAFEITADGVVADVAALKTYTDAEIGTVRQENSSNFSVLAGRINAKAESSTVSALGTRLNTVEWEMDAVEGQISQKVSKTEYNGNTIASLINQTATTIDIQASRINLVGAVSVLSDISGNLGTITAGNINIAQDIRVGNGIYLGNQASTQAKSLYFFNTANITAYNYGAATAINFNADEFKLAGFRLEAPSLGYVNAPKLVQSAGVNPTKIELAFSTASNRLYVDINGSRKGFLQIDKSSLEDGPIA